MRTCPLKASESQDHRSPFRAGRVGVGLLLMAVSQVLSGAQRLPCRYGPSRPT